MLPKLPLEGNLILRKDVALSFQKVHLCQSGDDRKKNEQEAFFSNA